MDEDGEEEEPRKKSTRSTRSTRSTQEPGPDPLNDVLMRIIQKQWETQRKQRTNKYELSVYEEPNLFLATGDIAKHYLEALKAIGCEAALTEFHLDKVGFSPEIAALLGDAYLKDNIIITDPRQQHADFLVQYNSMLELVVDSLFQTSPQKELIDIVTRGEALYGEVKNDMLKCLCETRKPSGKKFNLSVILETPSNALKKIRELRKNINALKQDPEPIKKDSVAAKIAGEAQSLLEIYEDLRAIEPESCFPFKVQVDAVKMRYNSADIYCFGGAQRVVVYFGNMATNGTIVRDKLAVINGNDHNSLLNQLHALGYIRAEPELVGQKIMEISSSIYDVVPDETKDPGAYIEAMVQKASKEPTPELRMYQELEQKISADSLGQADFESLPMDIKSSVVAPVRFGGYMQEIITLVNSGEMFWKYQYNTARLKEEIEQAGENRGGLIKQLVESIKYQDQENLSFNTWLRDNYGDLCREIGISFVTQKGEKI